MFGRTLRTRMLAVFSALTVTAVFAAALAIGATAAPRQAQAAESQVTLALTAQAQKGVANVMIFNTVGKANPPLTKTVKKYDITGDGKADAIKFVITPSYRGYASTLRIYVRGKLCYTSYGIGGSGFFTTGVQAKYLRLKNGRPFLFVTCNTNNGDGTQEVLQFRKGKLYPVVSQSQLPTGYGNHNQVRAAVASGNKIKVTFSMMTYAAGAVETTHLYKMKNGLLRRANSQSASLKYLTSTGSGYKEGRAYAKARASFKVYKSAGSSKVVFSVKAGQKIKLTRACIKSGKLYYRVLATSGKSGWFEAPKRGFGQYGGNTLLEGTYMAG